MKSESDPYELILGAIDAPREEAVQKPQEVFDEAAARGEIDGLRRKIKEENEKQMPDYVAISRYEHEIVVIRQQIIQNQMKR